MTCDQGQQVSLNRISGESTWMLFQATWFRISKLILRIFCIFLEIICCGEWYGLLLGNYCDILESGIICMMCHWIGIYTTSLADWWNVFFMLLIQSFVNLIRKWIELWYCIFKFTILSNEDLLQVAYCSMCPHCMGGVTPMHSSWVGWPPQQVQMHWSRPPWPAWSSPLWLHKRLPVRVGSAQSSTVTASTPSTRSPISWTPARHSL